MNYKFFLAAILLIVTSITKAQVSLQTGAAQFSLPLYSFNDPQNRIGTGISLGYTCGNGLKVSEMASSVGTGWSLQMGGVITRLQKGEPDDQKQDNPYDVHYSNTNYINNYYPNGYMYTENAYRPELPVTNGGAYVPLGSSAVYKPAKPFLADREQDVFAFSFNGRSGEFVIGRDGSIQTLEDSKLKIDKVITNMSAQGIRTRISEFQIVDEWGIKYIFKDRELSEVLKYDDYGTPGDPNVIYSSTDPVGVLARGRGLSQFVVSKWFLSEIQNPFANKSIKFFYEEYSIDINGAVSYQQARSGNFVKGTFVVSKIKGRLLRPIRVECSPEEKVELEYYAASRLDIPGDKALKAVRVLYHNELKTYWEFKFGYTGMVDMLPFDYPVTHGNYNENKPFFRLYLKSVQHIGRDNSFEPPYNFDYYLKSLPYSNNPVPARFSYYQDHWGYSNATNNVWGYTVEPGDDFEHIRQMGTIYSRPLDNPTHNRRIESRLAQDGILKTIHYPLGSALTFEYEQNYVKKNATESDFIGGVRVNKTISTDGSDLTKDIITEYKYVQSDGSSSGWGYDNPVYSATETVNIRKSSYNPGIDFQQVSSMLPRTINTAVAIGFGNNGAGAALLGNFLNCSPTMATFIAAVAVNLIIKVAGDIFSEKYKDYTITNNSPYALNLSNPLPVLYARVEVKTIQFGSQVGKTVQEFTSAEDNPVLHPVLDFPYSQKPRLSMWLYGLPKHTITYDAQNRKVKELVNVYNYYQNEINDVNFISQKWVPNYRHYELSTEDNLVYSAASDWITHDFYKPYHGRTELVESKEYTYADNGQFSLKTTAFVYSPQNFQVQRVTTTNTKGQAVEMQTLYPKDYSPAAVGFVQTMQDHNLLNIPVATYSYVTTNGVKKMTGGTVSEFGSLPNGDFRVLKNYSFESTDAVPQSSVPLSSTTLLPGANYFKLHQSYAYDDKGVAVETNKEGRKVTTIYGYDNRLSIATVANAGAADVAYTSFEDGENSLIPYDWNGVMADASAPTGKNVYDVNLTPIELTLHPVADQLYCSFWAKGDALVMNSGTLVKQSAANVYGWRYYQYALSKSASGTIALVIGGAGTILIDELRLYPQDAQMTTCTYDPLYGKTSESDINNKITYYEYDGLGRLTYIRNEYRDVVKTYQYNYQTSRTVFYSKDASTAIARNNCPAGYKGTSVVYPVPAHKYISLLSQADADAQAAADVQANGQAYANNPANGAICNPSYPVLSYENLSPDGRYADVVVRFYQDAAHTIPATVYNYELTYHRDEWCDIDPNIQTYTYTVNVNGQSMVRLESQAILYYYAPCWDYYYEENGWMMSDWWVNYYL